MALELKQTVRLSQQLVMTPQLQQAIKLLQLSRIELVDLVQKELQENPVLEEGVEEDERTHEDAPATDSDAESDTGTPGASSSSDRSPNTCTGRIPTPVS